MQKPKRTKVLYVITKSNFGGAQRYVYDLATSLPDSYEPVVAFGGTGELNADAGLLEEMLNREGVRTIFIKNFAFNIFFFKEFLALFELVTLFRKEKPTIVHLNSSKAGGLGALAGRIARVPKIIYTSHGWAHTEPISLISKMFRWTAALVTVFLCHRVISISHFETLNTPLGLPTTLIHNGVGEFNFMNKEAARAELRKIAPIPPDTFLIGTIAELHPSKGLDVLITAVTKFTTGHVVIIGEGRSRHYLQELIQKQNVAHRVHLTGFIKNAPHLLKAFDIFVLPSRKEGLGYVLLEAGSAGIPVVSTTVGGIPEIIEDGISGELIVPDDPVGLADALQCLYTNHKTRARFGEALKEKVERFFNLRGMVKRVVEVYEL